jgi:hypothetical protein
LLSFGTTKQLAEEVDFGSKHPSAAKAAVDLVDLFGTTKVVPFQNSPPRN